MAGYKCGICTKDFDSAGAFEQHNLAKHAVKEKPKRKNKQNKLYGVVIVILIVSGIAYLTLTRPSYTPLLPASDHVKGSGALEVVEFSDFQCPACGAAYPQIKNIVAQYNDKVKFIYKHFPLPSHPFAFKAAEASECAADQGKFWEYHDK